MPLPIKSPSRRSISRVNHSYSPYPQNNFRTPLINRINRANHSPLDSKPNTPDGNHHNFPSQRSLPFYGSPLQFEHFHNQNHENTPIRNNVSPASVLDNFLSPIPPHHPPLFRQNAFINHQGSHSTESLVHSPLNLPSPVLRQSNNSEDRAVINPPRNSNDISNISPISPIPASRPAHLAQNRRPSSRNLLASFASIDLTTPARELSMSSLSLTGMFNSLNHTQNSLERGNFQGPSDEIFTPLIRPLLDGFINFGIRHEADPLESKSSAPFSP
ncbi:MAG: hypothetical protein JWM09_473 [Francisellaceae bacterium]|nr:hypothetical protein [Francisellaceae bacterium]